MAPDPYLALINNVLRQLGMRVALHFSSPPTASGCVCEPRCPPQKGPGVSCPSPSQAYGDAHPQD